MGLPGTLTIFKSTHKRTSENGPAFYAQPKFFTRSWQREWWTLLHPPYTLMHLSFVVIGAFMRVLR